MMTVIVSHRQIFKTWRYNPGLGIQNEINQPRHGEVVRCQFAIFGNPDVGVEFIA